MLKDNIYSIGPLKAIQEVTFQFEIQRYQPLQVHKMNQMFNILRQSKHMTTSAYLKNFNYQQEVIEAYGGIVRYNKGMVVTELSVLQPPLDLSNTTFDKMNNVTKTVVITMELVIKVNTMG